MSEERRRRLGKLVKLQGKLKALHETRHAAHVATAAAADEEARSIAERFDAADAMSALFPDVYHRGIKRAVDRREREIAAAKTEADRAAVASARQGIVADAYRDTARLLEREAGDRERQEIVERRLGSRK